MLIIYIVAALNLMLKDEADTSAGGSGNTTRARPTRLRDAILTKKKEIMDRYAEYYRDCARKPHRNTS